MLAKDGALSFDVNAQTKRPINAAIQFSTQDIKTARLSFKLTKDGVPLPLSAVVGKLVLSMADGSRFIRAITLVNKPEGLAEYVLSADEIRHYGNVKAELILYYTNGQALSIHKFGFSIEQSLIDQNIVPVAEYYIDDFETLRGQINDLYDDVVATVAEIEAKFEDLDNVETKVGAQEKVDAHANNSDVHVTAKKKAEWDAKETTAGAQAKVTAHANDAIKHVTNEERSTWNSKETTSGAQQKADAALQAAKDLMANFQQRKITEDTGLPLISLKDTSGSILESIINNGLGQGTFYAIARSRDLPNTRSFRGFYHMTDATNGKGTFGWVYATDYFNNVYTNYLNNNVWSGWRRILTDADATPTWETPSLGNGWKQYVSPDGFPHTVRYTKDAFGVVEIVGSIAGGALGNNVAAFTLLPDYFPIQSMHFIGVASSVGTTNVPQYHRTYIGTDGKVCIQSCSNTANPNEFITFGFRFKAAKV
ncbi:tail fiber protein [Bacillus phage vB_BauS_KLEB27-1]|uniref:phage baseplate upper protein n=1 Tax=Bacillus pumilus TaxID=1408 RepID=UPI002045F449|nr:tail fiber protein [Bacillus phage vB_BauS_KLEB27-1]